MSADDAQFLRSLSQHINQAGFSPPQSTIDHLRAIADRLSTTVPVPAPPEEDEHNDVELVEEPDE